MVNRSIEPSILTPEPLPAVLPAANGATELDALKGLISEALSTHKKAAERLCASLVDGLEGSVRLGWYFSDARSFLVERGEWCRWVETNFDVGLAWTSRLRKLGRAFSRDLPDKIQRDRLGIKVEGLSATVGEHLRNQLQATGAASLNELLRLCGARPPTPKQQKSLSAGKPLDHNGVTPTQSTAADAHQAPAPSRPSAPLQEIEDQVGVSVIGDPFSVVLRGLGYLHRHVRAIDPTTLSPLQSKMLASQLGWLTEFYQSLRPPE